MRPDRLSRRALGVLAAALVLYTILTLLLNVLVINRARDVVFRGWVAELDDLGALAACDAAPERFSRPDRGIASLVPLDPRGRPYNTTLPPAPGWPTDLKPGEIRDLSGPWRDARWIAAMDTGRAGACRYFLLYGLVYNPQPAAWTALNLVGRLGAISALLATIWFLAIQPLVKRVRGLSEATRRVVDADFADELPVQGDDELAELARAFNEATRAARERLELLRARDRLTRSVVADIAHDVRTPLAALKIAAGRIVAGRTPSPMETVLLSELSYLEGLIANLTRLAQLQGTTLPEERHPVDLGALTARVVSRFRLLAHARGVSLNEALPGAPLELRCDPLGVEQALGNLVHNAVEFAQGHTAVLCYVSGGAAVLEVRDDGPGVQIPEIPRLRERFFRGDDAAVTGRHGQGLGLAIADEVARRHGGALEIGPDPEGGTRATVRLPLRDCQPTPRACTP